MAKGLPVLTVNTGSSYVSPLSDPQPVYGYGGDVEGNCSHRRSLWRHPGSDRGRYKRLPCFFRRGCGQRIVQLLKEPEQRQQSGLRAHYSVRQRFLMSRLIEQYLDLFSGFEATYFLDQQRLSASGLPVTMKKSPHQP